MRKAAVLLVSVLVVFIFLGIVITQSLVMMQLIATVTEVVPPVWVKSGGQADFKALYDDATVRAGDLVKTGEDGKLTLNWVDGSRVRLEPSTTLTVRKCSLNKGNGVRTSLFHLDVGRVWIRVLELVGERSKFEIKTPTATAGVRGTVFSVEVSPGGETQVSVYEGSVEVEGTGRVVEASAGENAVLLPETGAKTDGMTEADRAAWAEQSGIIGPRLQVKTPASAEVAADTEKVTVAGIAEPEAEVTVNGEPVELESGSRFHAELPFDRDESRLKLVVTARDARGAETSQELVLSRTQ